MGLRGKTTVIGSFLASTTANNNNCSWPTWEKKCKTCREFLAICQKHIAFPDEYLFSFFTLYSPEPCFCVWVLRPVSHIEISKFVYYTKTYCIQEVSSEHSECTLVKYQQFFYTAYQQEFRNHICTSNLLPHISLFAPGNEHQLQHKEWNDPFIHFRLITSNNGGKIGQDEQGKFFEVHLRTTNFITIVPFLLRFNLLWEWIHTE